jgi:hypothetical protein
MDLNHFDSRGDSAAILDKVSVLKISVCFLELHTKITFL